eukprot:184907-Chlamydomonas_euryale.AAC.4
MSLLRSRSFFNYVSACGWEASDVTVAIETHRGSAPQGSAAPLHGIACTCRAHSLHQQGRRADAIGAFRFRAPAAPAESGRVR